LRKPIERDEPLRLLIDSTGLKMYGESEWLEEKHGKRSRRRWRKLGQNLYGGSRVKRLLAVHVRLSVAVECSPVHALLITAVAAGRLDFGESIIPALRPAPAVLWLAAFDRHPRLGRLLPGAIESLSFCVAQSELALGVRPLVPRVFQNAG
jgi:hypothetical protein